jgi:hypothetical protein
MSAGALAEAGIVRALKSAVIGSPEILRQPRRAGRLQPGLKIQHSLGATRELRHVLKPVGYRQ